MLGVYSRHVERPPLHHPERPFRVDYGPPVIPNASICRSVCDPQTDRTQIGPNSDIRERVNRRHRCCALLHAAIAFILKHWVLRSGPRRVPSPTADVRWRIRPKRNTRIAPTAVIPMAGERDEPSADNERRALQRRCLGVRLDVRGGIHPRVMRVGAPRLSNFS